MSYSDRKEGNWDYQRINGYLKQQEKANKAAIKAAKKTASYQSAPKTHTVDEVMADYNNWLSGQTQPKTADQVMADFNAWNADEEGWMAAQTQPAQQKTQKRQQKKEEKQGPIRVSYDPFSQQRPDPTAITKGKEIPELQIADASSAYNDVVNYKEAVRSQEREKERQEERHAKNKAARLAKLLERSEKVKAQRDNTYHAPKKKEKRELSAKQMNLVGQVARGDMSRVGEFYESIGKPLPKQYDANGHELNPLYTLNVPKYDANGFELNQSNVQAEEYEAARRQAMKDAREYADEYMGRYKYGDEGYEKKKAELDEKQKRFDELNARLRNADRKSKQYLDEVNAARERIINADETDPYYNSEQMQKDQALVDDYMFNGEQNYNLTQQEELEYNRLSMDLLSSKERNAIRDIARNENMDARTVEWGNMKDPVKAAEEARALLKDYGWSDDKIHEYSLRMQRVLNEEYALEHEKPAFEINEDDSGLATFGKSVGNWFDARRNSIFGIEGLLSNLEEKPEGQGRDPYSGYGRYNRLEELSDQEVLDKAIGDNAVGRFAYGVSASMGDLGAQMLVAQGLSSLFGVAGAGAAVEKAAETGVKVDTALKRAASAEKLIQNLSLASFGAKGYESAYAQARENGASEEGAQLRGIAGALAEVITEKVSLDNLWGVFNDPNAFKNILKNVLRSGIIEGSEEMASDAVNDAADAVITALLRDTKTDYRLRVEQYIANGMSAEDAELKVLQDRLVEYLTDGLAGALSGAGMGGATSVASEISNIPAKRLQKQIEALEKQRIDDFNKSTSAENDLSAQTIPELQAPEENITLAENSPVNNVNSQENQDLDVLAQSPATDSYTIENIDEMNGLNQDAIPEVGPDSTPQQIFDRQVAANAQQMPTDTASVAYTENITPEMDVPEYTQAFNNIYTAGVTGVDFNTAISGQMSDFIQNELGTEKAQAIYNAGVQDYQAEDGNNASANTFKEFKIQRGTGSFKDVRTKKAGRVNTQFLNLLAKATGLDIELADQTDPRFRAWINPEKSKITVTEGNIAQVMHELGEFTEFYNSADFENIRQAAMDASAKVLGNDAFQRTLEAYNRAYRTVESDKTVLGASQEMTNDYLVSLMNTQEGQQALANSLAQRYGSQAQGLVDKIKAFFDKLIRSMRSILKNSSLSGYQQQMLQNKIEENERNINMFLDAFNKAIDTYQQTAEQAGVSVDSDGTNRFSIATYEEGGRDYLVDYLINNSGLTQKDQNAIMDTLDWAYNIATGYANDEDYASFSKWSNTRLERNSENKPLLEVMRSADGRAVRSVIVNNGDYPLNIDFSQVCKKRIALNAVLNKLVSDSSINLAMLTESDVAKINQLIKGHDFEIACGLCFVDSKRYRVGSWSDSFVNGSVDEKTNVKKLGWNDLVKSMLKDGTTASYFELAANHDVPAGTPLHELSDDQIDFSTIDQILSKYPVKKNGKLGGRPTEEAKMAYLLKTDPSSRRFLDRNDIIASEGLDALRVKYNNVYSLVNAHGGTSKPKLSHGFTAYGNDILKSDSWKGKKFTLDNAYSVGGVRVQSFSDYVANMFFDYMQMFADMAGKELPSHAYTKEAVYARLFGMTGQRINMSLIFKGANLTPEQSARLAQLYETGGISAVQSDPEFGPMCEHAGLDENGNYIFEDESFDYDEALAIQNDPRYKNVGTIGVGLSDAHIRKMLNDDNIKMVIPYHASGVSQIIKNARNLVLYTDYTGVQNTRGSDGTKLEKGDGFDWYGRLKSEHNKNGHDAKTVAQEYLDYCDKNNYTPKFDQFRNEPNYYKLLIDFRSYDNEGNFMPQGPVTMTFPEEAEFKRLVSESLTAQQETEDRLDYQMQDKQGRLYNEVKDYFNGRENRDVNGNSLDVDYINQQLDEQELFEQDQNQIPEMGTFTANVPESIQEIPEVEAPKESAPEPIPEMGDEIQNTGRTKRSDVVDNSLRRSGIFNEPEFNEIVSDLANIQEQHEQETVDLAISRIMKDHDGVMDGYMNANNKTIKSYGDADVDAMFMLIQEQKRVMDNAVDEATKKQARDNIRRLSLTLRKTGTGIARGLQAFAKWTRNAEGTIATAEVLRHSAVQKAFENNPRLKQEVDELAGEIHMQLNLQFFSKGKAPTKSEAKDLVNTILDTNQRVSKKISDDAIEELTEDMLNKKMAREDLEERLEMLSQGIFKIPDDVIDRVNELYDEMENYNFGSKEYVTREKEAYELLGRTIAPHGGTFDEKLDAWRYFAMLWSPNTHLRNILNNAIFKPVKHAKDAIAAAIEKGAAETIKARGEDRTKSILTPKDEGLINACYQDALDNAYRELTGNKYTGSANMLNNSYPAFDTTKKGGQRLNKLTGGNSNLLSKEDEAFKFGQFEHTTKGGKKLKLRLGEYQRAMASYLKANGANESIFQAEDEESKALLERARKYAIHEAQVATFQQQDSAGKVARKWSNADRLMRQSDSRTERNIGRMFDILVPFKGTNANVLETALSYSPAELIKLIPDFIDFKKGKLSTTEFIDHIAKAGTGLLGIGIGALLRALGMINLGGSDREEKFNKENGVSPYSINIRDMAANLAQMFPAAAPLVYGASIYDSLNDKENAIDTIFSGLSTMSDAVTDMSMLSSVDEILNAVKYSNSGSETALNLGYEVLDNLLSQLFPQIGKSINNTLEPNSRDTYYTDKKGMGGKVQKSLKYVASKVPFLPMLNDLAADSGIPVLEDIGEYFQSEPRINSKGEVQKNVGGDNIFFRALNNFANPFNFNENSLTDMDEERIRLERNPENKKTIPYIGSGASETTIGGEKLSPEEWTEYRKTYGQMREKIDKEFYNSDEYDDFSDSERADIFYEINKFSRAAARSEYGGKLENKQAEYMDIYEDEGPEAVAEAIIGDVKAKRLCDDIGVKTNTVAGKDIQAAYDDGDDELAAEYAEMGELIADSDLPSSAHGEAYKRLKWARDNNDDLDDEEWLDTYQYIDSLGDENGKVKQQELLEAINSDKKNAQQYIDWYWNYSTIPTLNDDGDYYAKRNSSKKSAKTSETSEEIPELTTTGTNGKEYAVKDQRGYQRGVKAYGSGYTEKQYVDTMKAINTNGGQITKAELQAYMKKHPDEADQLWATYAGSNWNR